MTAAPAHADPLISESVIVNNPAQATGLLSLCVTSRTLIPNGVCINL